MPKFAVGGFEPLPGYDSVRTVVQRATLAAGKLGYLGPVDDPESDRLGREAIQGCQTLAAELEFRDEPGQLLPVDFITFADGQGMGGSYLVLGGTIDEASAGVIATLSARHGGETGHEPPPGLTRR
jgi:hypothetical protein